MRKPSGTELVRASAFTVGALSSANDGPKIVRRLAWVRPRVGRSGESCLEQAPFDILAMRSTRGKCIIMATQRCV